jgi:hypothetical protein
MSNRQQKSERPKGEYIPFRLDPDTNAILTRIAITEKRTKSEIIRRYIEMGIKNDGYRPDDERLGQLIREAVQEIMKPHVERLASISAKAANIDAASFFLQVYVGRLMLPPSERDRMDEAAENARRLGIDYLKLRKGMDIDSFITAGAAGMKDI